MSDEKKTGYKQPPRDRQFKAGQSGYPQGRPKGTRNLKTDLNELLSGKVAVNINGRPRRISRQEFLLLSLHKRAALGDVKASTSLLNMVMKLNPATTEPAPDGKLSKTDEEIAAEFLRRNQTKPGGNEPCS